MKHYKRNKNKIISKVTQFIVSILRGTPLMLQLLIAYYVPWYMFKIPLRTLVIGPFDYRFIATIIAFSLNYAAYFGEIFRGGIQSIDRGQMEAGRSLGLTWWQTMKFIILPQAFKRIIPPLGNEFVAMLKDSSLVSVIGFEELTRRGQLIIARTYASMEIWACVALIYLVMVFLVARLVAVLEKRFNTDAK